MAKTMPQSKYETDWHAYIKKYGILDGIEIDKDQYSTLKMSKISYRHPAKNDAALKNFIVRPDHSLIGFDFESSVVKPAGWDLLNSARVLSGRYPDLTPAIITELVEGWIDDDSRENFNRLVDLISIYVSITRNAGILTQNDPAEVFFEKYRDDQASQGDSRKG